MKTHTPGILKHVFCGCYHRRVSRNILKQDAVTLSSIVANPAEHIASYRKAVDTIRKLVRPEEITKASVFQVLSVCQLLAGEGLTDDYLIAMWPEMSGASVLKIAADLQTTIENGQMELPFGCRLWMSPPRRR